ncbi:ribonuclease H family protein [Methylobacterium planeticum]|uniref:ribonuclease H n=1 Tax=Methylobacterium planeticum TaxID=2615211 RepID=A0A6N6MLT4_9HYPH|nr:ribonuclease H [Methylobacterium planeticum]KAB1069932.1 ribonuclease HI [Methylobacterium planeticum]
MSTTITLPSAPLATTEERPQTETFTVHVDGSSLRNPGPARWAAVIFAPDRDKLVLVGSAPKATNNQMELWAAFEAFSALPLDATGVLYADSRYVVDGLTMLREDWARRGWRKSNGQRVVNTTLWKLLGKAADARPGIRVEWLRGHNGNAGNDPADRLARTEAEKVQAGCDPVGACGLFLEECALEDAELAAGRAAA